MLKHLIRISILIEMSFLINFFLWLHRYDIFSINNSLLRRLLYNSNHWIDFTFITNFSTEHRGFIFFVCFLKCLRLNYWSYHCFNLFLIDLNSIQSSDVSWWSQYLSWIVTNIAVGIHWWFLANRSNGCSVFNGFILNV